MVVLRPLRCGCRRSFMLSNLSTASRERRGTFARSCPAFHVVPSSFKKDRWRDSEQTFPERKVVSAPRWWFQNAWRLHWTWRCASCSDPLCALQSSWHRKTIVFLSATTAPMVSHEGSTSHPGVRRKLDPSSFSITSATRGSQHVTTTTSLSRQGPVFPLEIRAMTSSASWGRCDKYRPGKSTSFFVSRLAIPFQF